MTLDITWASEWVVLCPAQQIPCHAHLMEKLIGHSGDESFQAITCTATDNSKQTRENTSKKQNKQTDLHKKP